MTKNHVFKIVVAGEDFAGVMRARELSRRLAAELKPESEIRSDAWKFESLGNLQVGKEAARDAAKADMVIIAADGDVEPPAHVKSWIESWSPRKRKRVTVLVALCDQAAKTVRESSPLCAYLRRIAGKWGMEFLTNSAEARQPKLEFTAEASHPHHAGRDCARNE